MPQAATYDELIPALDNGGAAHLTELLGSSEDEAQSIILSYVACDDFHKDMLRARLKHLFENADTAQVHSFLRLIPRLDEPTPLMFDSFWLSIRS